MKRRIHIGVIGDSSGWDVVLDQMGASWEMLSSVDLLAVDAFSCVILTKIPSAEENNKVELYIQSGGALVDTTGQFFNSKKRYKKIRSISPHKEATDFNHIEPFTIRGKCLTLDEADYLAKTVKLPDENDRAIAFLGIPLNLALKSPEAETHLFPCSSGSPLTERTAVTPSWPLLQIVLKVLSTIHHHTGLPFIHSWWMTSVDKTVSTFRIDSDYGTDEALNSLNVVLTKHDIPATWFLHVKAHINDLVRFKQRPGDEIAVHGFDHAQFKSTKAATDDIQKAKETLNKHGFDVKGYAAPYGFWNRAVRNALLNSEFTYSSEFAFDFDSLPSYPSNGAPLQLPVHPISIGTLIKQGYLPDDMEAYYMEIIKMKLMQHQPIHLYHHPNDGNETVWDRIFSSNKYQQTQPITYVDWAKWWINRHQSEKIFYVDGQTITSVQNGEKEIPIAIHRSGNQFALTNRTKISFNELKFVTFTNPELNRLIRSRWEQSELSLIELQKRKFLSWRWRNKI